MQLVSISTLSALVIAFAATSSVQAVPAAHDANIVQRASSHHRAAVRAPAAAAAGGGKRGYSNVPSTLKKRASKEKKCRLRPTNTVTSTIVATPDVTATIDGAADGYHHGHHTSSDQQPAATTSAATPTGTFSTQWQLTQSREGNNFFDNWSFWNFDDPTHGTVTFVDSGTAWNEGLVSVSNGQAFMRANTDDNVGYRKSVRITDNYSFNDNTLLIMDASHMPTGCGTWPAWWANGPNWPSGGEIDILEGVNGQTQNQATLHTSEGCFASSDDSHPSTGQLTDANCGSSGSDNTGCGFTDTTSDNSFGAGFNSAGGGVYAMQWVDSGISVWFFTRSAIPDDIKANQPMPWTWPAPFAHWAASSCPPNQYFNNNNAIFDLTFCGDWAGADWGNSGCADSTGYSSCADYVSAVGSGFTEAYWAINYVKYFSQN